MRDWPTGVQKVVAKRMEANLDDLAAYEGVRAEAR